MPLYSRQESMSISNNGSALEHDKTRMRTLLIKISHVRESSIRFISNMRAY